MKAALDTNILLDILAGESRAAAEASQLLSGVLVSGPVMICPVVYSELAAGFDEQREVEQFLEDFGITVDQFSREALTSASAAWQTYTRRRSQQLQCPKCGSLFDASCPICRGKISWRQHIISDFLVGGHALAQADLLISRDAGYYRTYFPRLRVLAPGEDQ